mgnify:CR=1 FL=1
MIDFSKYREDFPILKRKISGNDLIFFDNGATTQKPNQVIDTITDYYKNYNSNIHRSVYTLGDESEKIYEGSKELVREFINANSYEEIIYTSGTTEGLNFVARILEQDVSEGDEIILGISNHHANIVPWQFIAKKKKAKLKYVYLDDNDQFDLNDFKYKMSDKTKIVAVSAVVNVTGVIQPIKEIIEIAHKWNALVVVDAAQSVLHFKHDVQELDADFLVFSGHKIFAPMGIGVMYGKEEILNKMSPFLYGGDMIEFVTEQDSTFAQLPNKFEGGTQNVGGAVGLQEAINFLGEIGYEKINEVEARLYEKAMKEMNKLGFIETYSDENVEKTGVIAFNVKGVHSHDVSFILDSYDVAIRSGHHCAQPLMSYLDVPSCCRVSFSIYNDEKDVDKLIEGLKKVGEIFLSKDESEN